MNKILKKRHTCQICKARKYAKYMMVNPYMKKRWICINTEKCKYRSKAEIKSGANYKK